MNSLSLRKRKWILKSFNNEDISFFKENFSLDEITSKLLSIRNIKREDVSTYLNPSIKNLLPNPNILKDMKKSSKRLLEAIKKFEKIGIFGDYDVDGASSTALLGNFFSSIKIDYEFYIPDRKKEGYGPSIQAFEEFNKKGVKLIFTVDCGTLSFEAIKYAYENKIDVIVLDHHQSEISLPRAYSIINPNRFDDNSKLNYLCAAGVTFMFLVSVNRELRETNWYKDNNYDEPNLINYLDLVTLGTICDVVPLIGLNRAIVRQGLKVLKEKNNLGIKTLFDICSIEEKPNVYHIGYMIGPRINSGGRVGKSSHGTNLLINKNPKEVFKIASELDQFNDERKKLENDVLEKILNKIDKNLSDPVIIISEKNLHEGVIGIAASRLKDKFNKPVIIISMDQEIGKASARSVIGFDIGSAIIAATQENILLKGGGHKMAGGFLIKTENIKRFKEYIIQRFKKINENLKTEKNFYFDSIIAPTAMNIDFYNKINFLAPFGSGNPEPRFIIENVKTLNNKIIKDKHIKSILVGLEGSTIKTIAFNSVENEIGAYLLKKDKKLFNIGGKLSLNEWRGQSNVEFIIDDISVNKTIKKKVPSSIG